MCAPALVASAAGRHEVRIDTLDMLTLVERGKANVEIVAPSQSSVVKFAAEELQKFLQQATGAKIEIVRARTGTIPVIVVGDNAWARDAAGIDVGKLPRGAFRVKRAVDVIYIAGRDEPFLDLKRYMERSIPLFERGTLNGVYDFLERFVGVRFLLPCDEGTVVPKIETLRVPMMDIYEAPDFTARRVSYYSGRLWGKHSKEAERSVKNLARLRWRASSNYIPNCHSLIRSGVVQRFCETNPEYFALMPNGKRNNDLSLPGHPGHLCYSSQGLEDEVYKDAVSYLTGQPPFVRKVVNRRGIQTWDWNAFMPGYFNIMPNDGYGERTFCHCPKCWAFHESDRTSDLIWGFVCRVAKRLQDNGIPGKVTAMVYGPYRAVPDFEIPSNVMVMVATAGPWAEKSPVKAATGMKEVTDWSKKIGAKVWMWNYINDNNQGRVPKGVPPVSTKYIESFYKRVAPHVFGSYTQSSIDYYLFQCLNYYVIHKLFWNIETDVTALVAEYHEKMFGPAAEPMAEFFARIEELWTTRVLGEFKSTPLGPVTTIPTEREVWEETYTDEVFAEFEALYDRAERLTRNDASALKRVRWFHEHFLGEMLRARQAYKDRSREVDDLVLQVTPLPQGQAIEIDGRLDDAAWQNASSVYLVPWKSDKAVVNTRVAVRWSRTHLYLAFECEEPHIEKLYVSDRQRDDQQTWKDSSIEVFLNPSCDRAICYQLIVSAKGVVADCALRTDKDGVKTNDWAWDSTALTATKVEAKRWTCEIAIPVSDMAAGELEAGAHWVANFNRGRNITDVPPEENQLYTWSPFLNKGFHDFPRFGRLAFVVKAESSNMIKNGSFERDTKRQSPADWYGPREPELKRLIQVDTGTFRDGRRSLRITNAKERLLVTQYLPDMKPNRKFRLTYFIKTDNVERRPGAKRFGACVNVQASAPDGQNYFFPVTLHKGTMPWTKQGFTFKTGPNTGKKHRPYIRLYLYGSEGTVWYDDVRIGEVE